MVNDNKNIVSFDEYYSIMENDQSEEETETDSFSNLPRYEQINKITEVAKLDYDLNAISVKDKHVSFPDISKDERHLLDDLIQTLEDEYRIRVDVNLKEDVNDGSTYYILQIKGDSVNV